MSYWIYKSTLKMRRKSLKRAPNRIWREEEGPKSQIVNNNLDVDVEMCTLVALHFLCILRTNTEDKCPKAAWAFPVQTIVVNKKARKVVSPKSAKTAHNKHKMHNKASQFPKTLKISRMDFKNNLIELAPNRANGV